MKRIVFISDLHLSEDHPFITEKFYFFLKNILLPEDTLHIVGDFFQYYLGSNCVTHYQKKILEVLKDAPQTIYFQTGNRDFLIEPNLLQQYDIHYLPDVYEFNFDSKKILVSHGDQWCLNDKGYQTYRKCVRSPFIQKAFLLLPKQMRYDIAKLLRNQSKKNRGELNQVRYTLLDDIDLSAAINTSRFNANLIIHGHTHNPILEILFDERRPKKRIALSDWTENQGNAYILSPKCQRFIYF